MVHNFNINYHNDSNDFQLALIENLPLPNEKISSITIENMKLNLNNIPMFIVNGEDWRSYDFEILLYHKPSNQYVKKKLFNNKKFYIYTPDQFISEVDGLNDSLNEAYIELTNLCNIKNNKYSPYVTYNEYNNYNFRIYHSIDSDDRNENAIQIYFCKNLQKLFDGFPLSNFNSLNYNSPHFKPPHFWRIYFKSDNISNNMLCTLSNYNSIQSWWKINKIILKTDLDIISTKIINNKVSNNLKILDEYYLNFNPNLSPPCNNFLFKNKKLNIIQSKNLNNKYLLQLYYMSEKGEIHEVKTLPGDSFSCNIIMN